MLRNTKREHYAKTLALRDEAGAPDHLETAADVLIKDLARKQVSTTTTLGEQLRIRQEFEKGAELRPWTQTGLSSLERFRTRLDPEGAAPSTAPPRDYSLESIGNRSGLTRHELELSTAEKPGSQTSKLYRFALGNLRRKKEDSVPSPPDGHPLNRLKQIAEEAFGGAGGEGGGGGERAGGRKKSRSRKRRRRRSPGKAVQGGGKIAEAQEAEGTEKDSDVGEEDTKSYRPSLWDVKDVRKLCRKDGPGCRPPKMYAIEDGRIVQVDAGDS